MSSMIYMNHGSQAFKVFAVSTNIVKIIEA